MFLCHTLKIYKTFIWTKKKYHSFYSAQSTAIFPKKKIERHNTTFSHIWRHFFAERWKKCGCGLPSFLLSRIWGKKNLTFHSLTHSVADWLLWTSSLSNRQTDPPSVPIMYNTVPVQFTERKIIFIFCGLPGVCTYVQYDVKVHYCNCTMVVDRLFSPQLNK